MDTNSKNPEIASPEFLDLKKIKDEMVAHVPLDPLALDMLPPESRTFIANSREYVAELILWLQLYMKQASLLETQLLGVKPAMKELTEKLDNLNAAVAMYSSQSSDPMFEQHIALCLDQVNQQKQAK